MHTIIYIILLTLIGLLFILMFSTVTRGYIYNFLLEHEEFIHERFIWKHHTDIILTSQGCSDDATYYYFQCLNYQILWTPSKNRIGIFTIDTQECVSVLWCLPIRRKVIKYLTTLIKKEEGE